MPYFLICQFQEMELLMSYGAKVDARNSFDETPLHLAVVSSADGRTEDLVKYLIERGANPNAVNKCAPHSKSLIHQVLILLILDFFNLILKSRSSPQILIVALTRALRYGVSALAKAVSLGREGVVQVLLDNGVAPTLDIFTQLIAKCKDRGFNSLGTHFGTFYPFRNLPLLCPHANFRLLP